MMKKNNTEIQGTILFSYENYLKKKWNPNIEDEPTKDLKILSLFSGCGGMDLGFEGNFICHSKSIHPQNNWIKEVVDEKWIRVKSTRFKISFANDILHEAHLAWTNYFQKFGYDPSIYHTDSIVDLVKRHQAGKVVFPNDIDIITGGFPCQDFSVAGKRKGFNSDRDHNDNHRETDEPSEETRGKLYFWMKQVIDIVKPKMFIAENVKGLVTLADVKDIIQRDFAQADGDGYIVLNPQVLHAGNYGVPESRERVIFIGIRKSALNKKALTALTQQEIPAEFNPYPEPTHACTFMDNGLMPMVTCKDIFANLQEPENSDDSAQQIYSKAKYLGKRCQGQIEIRLDNVAPTIRSEHHGNIEFRRLSAEHGGKHLAELNAGLQERRLTVRECALIQTFPPDYPFIWKKEVEGNILSLNSTGAYRVIGNAVPPVLAYNIAMRLQELWSLYFD